MIGVFDSGLGGLTVVKSLKEQLPEYSFIYLGDTAHLPYGTKDPSLIRSWSQRNIKWLRRQGAEIVVIACHTASAIAGQALKGYFSFPLFEMTTPLLEMVRDEGKNHRLGIIGTPATIQSGFYQNKLQSAARADIFFQACPLFVPLVEEGWIDKPGTKEIVRATLLPLIEKRVDTLVLACTHYPLLQGVIEKIMPKVKILNPAHRLAINLKNFLEEHPKVDQSLEKKESQFFFSAQPYHFSSISRACLGTNIQPRIITIYD